MCVFFQIFHFNFSFLFKLHSIFDRSKQIIILLFHKQIQNNMYEYVGGLILQCLTIDISFVIVFKLVLFYILANEKYFNLSIIWYKIALMAFIRYVRAILVIKFPELFAHAESESKCVIRFHWSPE